MMESISTFVQELWSSDSFWGIGLQLLVTVAAIVITASAASFLLKYVIEHTQRSTIKWDDVIVQSIHRPLILLIVLWGSSIGLAQLEFQWFTPEILISTFRIIIIVCLLWTMLRFLRFSEPLFVQNVERRDTNLDQFGIQAINKVLRILLIAIAVLMGFQTMGFSISGLLTFGGVGGLIVGFAAKDMLSNFFGGLMIYLDRPFTEGDWIRSPDREIEGTVERVGWRQTRIRTFERRPIYVPNAIFTQITVENPSRMENRRFRESIGVRYSDLEKVSLIVDEIKALLLANGKIDSDKLLIVGLEKFDASSVNILVYTYTYATQGADFYDLKQEILLSIADIIKRNGAEIAYPTQLVYLNRVENSN